MPVVDCPAICDEITNWYCRGKLFVQSKTFTPHRFWPCVTSSSTRQIWSLFCREVVVELKFSLEIESFCIMKRLFHYTELGLLYDCYICPSTYLILQNIHGAILPNSTKCYGSWMSKWCFYSVSQVASWVQHFFPGGKQRGQPPPFLEQLK